VSDTPRTDAAVRDVDVAFVGHWGLSAIGHELLEETAIHVGRLLGDGDRDGVFIIGFFDALNPQALQVQHRAGQLGLRDPLFNA